MMLRPKFENMNFKSEAIWDENTISFESIYQNYCVGIVDVVDSTKIISKLSQEKACIYYSVFLNTMGYIAKNHGAQVVKNTGDGVLFYFPKDSGEDLKNSLDCASKMIEASSMMNGIFDKQKMPKVQYRLSLDYGPLMIATNTTSSCKDIFGSTVNLCSKLNRIAKPNGIVIGSDLYEIVKKTKQYKFDRQGQFQSALKQDYPVYRVTCRQTV
jgi:adenylate cyclase